MVGLKIIRDQEEVMPPIQTEEQVAMEEELEEAEDDEDDDEDEEEDAKDMEMDADMFPVEI